MKKIFSYVIALMACALTFSGCEKKIDSPLVGNWNIRGTLAVVNADGTTSYYAVLRRFSFIDNGTFQYNDYLFDSQDYATSDGWILTGTWEVDGDMLTLHKQKFGTVKNNEPTFEASFKAKDELIKWRIADHYLHLTRNYGAADQYEEEFYDGSGAH